MAGEFTSAWRGFRRSGTFPLVVVLMLALAIGTATAIFSIAHAVILRPLPFQDPERLVMLWGRNESRGAAVVVELSLADYREWQARSRSLAAIEILSSVNWSHHIAAPGEPYSAPYSAVSGTFFKTLGVEPMLGRTFSPEDDRVGARATVIMSADLWRRRFNGDPGIIGRSLTIGEGANAEPHEVIGVMRPEFDFPRGAELWTPARREMGEFARRNKEGTDGVRVFYGLGRLAEGATLEQVTTEISGIARQFEINLGDTNSRASATATPLPTFIFGPARPAVLAMAAGVAVLVLIACANAAGLLLARGLAREREVAIRLALGATRRHLLRHAFAEAALLVGMSGALGVALAAVTFRALVALAPVDVPRLDDAAINGTSLAFAVAVCVLTCLTVALAPSWHFSGGEPAHGLSDRHTSSGGRRAGRARRALVAVQLGAAVVLLAAAALLGRSFMSIMRVDLGFDPRDVLTFHIGAPAALYDTKEKEWQLVERIVAELEQLPGAAGAGAIYERPFAAGPIGMDSGLLLEGQPLSAESTARNPIANWESVTPGYFRAMDIRLVRGRLFDDRDREKAPLAVIVSERLAAQLWPGQDPIGKRLLSSGMMPQSEDVPLRWQTVVGVVEDARYREVQAPRFDLYVPFRQAFAGVKHYVVRLPRHTAASTALLRERIARVNPAITAENVQRMEDIVSRTVAPWRFSMFVFAAFSAMALGFSAIGLAAVIAYSVKQRTREIGVRMALGARPAQVVRLIVREGMLLAAAGLAIGVPAALALTRLITSLLFEVSPTDAASLVTVVAALSAVALVATYLPARQVVAVDPVRALRSE